ncbi:histidine phosphatase family protein [Chromobacterium haemolyticum]|uniref:Histidine phosphatase family protein n=1 Tax=Chromobacterium haemolyticum TaxID=394935 RepID=A0ABS3GTM2_9NEIS|nr:histidine phosphatase family protein [Chromobacterium haemolyticum]MBK0416293.1 histidine phosphatase family protein [Chromobacterium haemolyticum]MBO0417563.1 histidine phosphatase family protein [Chromobacterium haemolyticum]MBO0500679.1 histidine phosphatase family protein [Chromobacterium haemolyticum]
MQHTTRFCVVRHGETDWNREYRLQGHTDIPLNPTGQEQAASLSRALWPGRYAFDALYVSDLTRTRQTAAPLQARLSLTPTYSAELRERHMGVFQGLTYAEAEQTIRDDYLQLKSRDPDYDLKGGESLNVFMRRIRDGFTSIARSHLGQTLLVITHGGVLEMMYRLATGKPMSEARDFPIPNAALNWLSYCDGRWQVEQWADESHLPAALDEIQ